jgi:hypothetical protein
MRIRGMWAAPVCALVLSACARPARAALEHNTSWGLSRRSSARYGSVKIGEAAVSQVARFLQREDAAEIIYGVGHHTHPL